MEKMMWGFEIGLTASGAVPLHKQRDFELGTWDYNLPDTIMFDQEVWDRVLEKASKAGLNALLLEVGDAIQYESHPEICLKDAWSKEKVRQEVKHCRDLGIELIPAVNFSTGHSYWMKEWRAMTSSPAYYKFAEDIIKELYELFEHPRYIHIAMDEEGEQHMTEADLVIFRRRDLLWHDMKFLIKTVTDTGAKAMIWHDKIFDDPDEFVRHISPDDVIIMPWYYLSYEREFFTKPIKSDEQPHWFNNFVDELERDGLTYLEERPLEKEKLNKFISVLVPFMKKGYKYMPTASHSNYSMENHKQTLKFFKNNAPDEASLPGFFTAEWVFPDKAGLKELELGIDLLVEARKIYYGE